MSPASFRPRPWPAPKPIDGFAFGEVVGASPTKSDAAAARVRLEGLSERLLHRRHGPPGTRRRAHSVAARTLRRPATASYQDFVENADLSAVPDHHAVPAHEHDVRDRRDAKSLRYDSIEPAALEADLR